MPVRNGALRLQKDDFNFPIVSFPFLCGNVSVAPAYVASLFHLICYRRYCDSYHGFLNRGLLLPRKPEVNSGAPVGLADHAPLVAPSCYFCHKSCGKS
jgi:hypothetical protein